LGLEKLSALRKAKERLRLWLRTEVVTGKRRLPGFSGLWRDVTLSDVLTEHGEASTGAEEVYSVSVHKGWSTRSSIWAALSLPPAPTITTGFYRAILSTPKARPVTSRWVSSSRAVSIIP
jgi:hypothetical protein